MNQKKKWEWAWWKCKRDSNGMCAYKNEIISNLQGERRTENRTIAQHKKWMYWNIQLVQCSAVESLELFIYYIAFAPYYKHSFANASTHAHIARPQSFMLSLLLYILRLHIYLSCIIINVISFVYILQQKRRRCAKISLTAVIVIKCHLQLGNWKFLQ